MFDSTSQDVVRESPEKKCVRIGIVSGSFGYEITVTALRNDLCAMICDLENHMKESAFFKSSS